MPRVLTLYATRKARITTGATMTNANTTSTVTDVPFIKPVLTVTTITDILTTLTSVPGFTTNNLTCNPALKLFNRCSKTRGGPRMITPLGQLHGVLRPTKNVKKRIRFMVSKQILHKVLGGMSEVGRHAGWCKGVS